MRSGTYIWFKQKPINIDDVVSGLNLVPKTMKITDSVWWQNLWIKIKKKKS